MANAKEALIVASNKFVDPKFAELRAPIDDVEALTRVLGDPAIGGFDVRALVNEESPVVAEELEGFFSGRKRDDFLLLYFSCHGIKDSTGRLYFVCTNTKFDRLRATGLSSVFVEEQIDQSDSKKIVVLLDCCYSGAFTRGMTARGDDSVDVTERLGGRGRIIITASNATEYAFESGELTVETGKRRPSVFTSAVVDALETGEADQDEDDWISVDELYEYVYDRVREQTPNQTPGKVAKVEGELLLAQSVRTPRIARLPLRLQEAIASRDVDDRIGATAWLARLLNAEDPKMALAAKWALERMVDEDDSREVSREAQQQLELHAVTSDPDLRDAVHRVVEDTKSGVSQRRTADKASPTRDELPSQADKTAEAPEPALINEEIRETETKVAVISAGTKNQPVGIAAGAGAVWVANKDSKAAWRIDPPTNKIAAKVSIGASHWSVALTEDAIWVGSGAALSRIDPATDTLVNKIRVPAYDVAVGEGAVWALTFTTLSRVDPVTNRVAFQAPLISAGKVAAGEGSIWIASSPWGKREEGARPEFLLRIDPQTGKVLSKIELGTQPVVGIAVTVAEGWVWVVGGTLTPDQQCTIWKIDPSSEQVVRSRTLEGPPLTELTAGGGFLWATGWDYNRLFRIDMETLELVVSSELIGSGALAFGAGAAWMTCRNENAVLRIEM